jgi:hypothetical protein
MEKLFKELPKPTMTPAGRDRIMERVRAEAARKLARRERMFEWSMYVAGVLLLGGVVYGVRRFWPDVELPDFPDFPRFHIPPVLILVTGCATLLLIFDSLLRKKFNH